MMPDYTNKISKGISKELDVDVALNISQMIPFEPHYAQENAFAYSMYINFDASTGTEKQKSVVAATATDLNASGTILFLYSYAPQQDLEWTRTASRTWAESIIAKNSQPPTRTPGAVEKVANSSVVGIIVGGIAGLIAYAPAYFKKRKS